MGPQFTCAYDLNLFQKQKSLLISFFALRVSFISPYSSSFPSQETETGVSVFVLVVELSGILIESDFIRLRLIKKDVFHAENVLKNVTWVSRSSILLKPKAK